MLLVLVLVLGLPLRSEGGINEFEEGKKKKVDAAAAAQAQVEPAKVPWRNSVVVYEHIFSAISLDQGAELTWNPYYAQSFSFRPRYYLRDDLSLRGRLDLEVELTMSDETDHLREWIVSDLLIDGDYSPSWMKIPVVGVTVSPNVRLTFPTSILSRGQSMMMGIGPGFALRREFGLLKGKVLSSIGLMYAFRATKYFHEFTEGQLDGPVVCSMANVENPGCVHTGDRNRSWRFSNSFEVRVQILEKLTFTADLLLFNDLLYGLDEETYSDSTVPNAEVGASRVNHRASTWAIFDVSYDLLDWLWLSVGTSTYYPQLTPDSSYRGPFFNRYTTFYFDVTLPVDRFVSQVQSWTGWGRKN